jgi:hypothetical protein
VPKKDPIYTQTRQINYYCWTSWKELISTLIYYELHKIDCDALLYVFLRNTYLGVKVEQFLSKAKLNNDDVKLVCKFLRKFSKFSNYSKFIRNWQVVYLQRVQKF